MQSANYSLSFSVLLFFLVLSIVDCKLFPVSSVYAEKDSIVLRTIITPIGSQSEKWGAAGLMVCIGGKAINQGGCGPITTVNKGWKIKENGTREEIEIKTNDIVIFKDTYGPLGKPNHQFDYTSGNELQSDTVYEVRGSGGSGECVIATAYINSGSISKTQSTPRCSCDKHIGSQYNEECGENNIGTVMSHTCPTGYQVMKGFYAFVTSTGGSTHGSTAIMAGPTGNVCYNWLAYGNEDLFKEYYILCCKTD